MVDGVYNEGSCFLRQNKEKLKQIGITPGSHNAVICGEEGIQPI